VKGDDAAINALEEADQHLNAALAAADFDPAELERIEERLFGLRAGVAQSSRRRSTVWPHWPRNTPPTSP
jgi:DNA repair protein RecN (Recombination protein N)